MKFQQEAERIFAVNENGALIAELTFPISEGVAMIDHTFVDESLRGQGVGDRLLELAVAQLREQGLKIHPTCPFAVKWFEKHPEYAELLTGESASR
ncbi:MAG: N-acetyltransferase [Clostridia bacterium]|jgi:predicted GNAT family acetyltransferase|nr:N-acetyltransferase [Clostridia bacterium]MBQ6000847.1 N-acetyltransferase [Clostridia bacterium]MBQ6058545.1 N-acetyltransferase [Clostridia bacterium]